MQQFGEHHGGGAEDRGALTQVGEHHPDAPEGPSVDRIVQQPAELVEGFPLVSLIGISGLPPQHAIIVALRIAEAVDAAHRAGITRVILPSRNARDLDDVPTSVREQMEFILADDMSQVLAEALEARGEGSVGVSISDGSGDASGPLHVRGS